MACGFLCLCGQRSTGDQRPIAEPFIPLGWNCNTFPQVMVSELLTESCAGRFPSNPQLQASVWVCHRFEGPLVELSFWGPVENGICLSSVMGLVEKTPLHTHTHALVGACIPTHRRAHTYTFFGHIPSPSAVNPHSEALQVHCWHWHNNPVFAVYTCLCVCPNVSLLLPIRETSCQVANPCIYLSVLPLEEKLTFF